MDIRWTKILRSYLVGWLVVLMAKYISANPADTKSEQLSCVHCAAPRYTQSKDFLDAVDQFLRVRGGIYPSDGVTSLCSQPSNISAIRTRKTCLSDFCYSVTFTDEQGMPWTMRSCAENLIALPRVRDKGNYCMRLPTTSPIKVVECSCVRQDVCPVSASPSSSSFKATGLCILSAIFAILNCLNVLIRL